MINPLRRGAYAERGGRAASLESSKNYFGVWEGEAPGELDTCGSAGASLSQNLELISGRLLLVALLDRQIVRLCPLGHHEKGPTDNLSSQSLWFGKLAGLGKPPNGATGDTQNLGNVGDR